MEKLPTEFKNKWIKALRSGEYKQGMGNLYSSRRDAYCCLGVACVVAGANKETIDGYGFIGYTVNVSVPVMLRTGNGSTLPTTLAHMNDAQGADFDQIADWIEEHL